MATFGDWVTRLEELNHTFDKAKPYSYVVIPNFFADDVAEQVYCEFPSCFDVRFHWKHYDNPIEQKYALNDFSTLATCQRVFDVLQSDSAIRLFQQVTGITDLQKDPYLHGAGLHAYPNRGKLDVHLDYSIHPITGKERRVNLIVYLNKNWKEEYGGALQLWDETMSTCQQVMPTFNTAILFRTSDVSYHGLPKPITCPVHMARQSCAIYYVSEPRPNVTQRYKASFVPLPGQPVEERLQKLYDIRKDRLIQPSDLWPSWRENGYGFW